MASTRWWVISLRMMARRSSGTEEALAGDSPRRLQHLEERVYDLGVGVGAPPALQLLAGADRSFPRVVNAGLGDRVEGIRHVDDTSRDWDVVARQPVWVTGAVEALVVSQNNRA